MTEVQTMTVSETLPGDWERPNATDDGALWQSVELIGRGMTFACDRPGPSPESPTVVLLHGWTATGSLNWATTITALS